MAKIDDLEFENLTEVEIDDENAQIEPDLEWDDDDPNLVDTFMQSQDGRDELKRIEDMMKDTFDEEWEAQTEYRDKTAKDWKSFIGFLEEKTFPYQNCANINVPIAYENIVRLALRMEGELFGDWTNIVGVLPTGPEDEPIAKDISKHDNWQMINEVPGFPRQMAKALLKYLLPGDVTCHSYYDVEAKVNRHEILSTDEFLVPNSVSSCDPFYADSPWMARIMHYQDHELHRMKGAWYGVDEILKRKNVSEDDELDSPLRDMNNEVHGTEKPEYPKYNMHKIILWVGWMDMPGHERPRYVMGHLYYETGKLLQLTIHEQASFEEIERYQAQEVELNDYRSRAKMYNDAFGMVEQSNANMAANPMVDEADKIASTMGTEPAPPAPLPPEWVGDQDPDDDTVKPPEMEKRPVLNFTHGVLIEPMEGTIGFGFGRLVADLNVAANIVIDQFVDAATISNTNELIVPYELEFAGEEKGFKSRPGKMHKARNMTGTDIRQSIMVMPKGQANPQMVQLCELLIKWGQSAIQSPDVLSGAPGKSGETAQGINIRSEHATKQLSVLTRKFSRFVANIFKQNARLNAIFLDDKKFVAITNQQLGQGGQLEMLEIGRSMYRRPYDVTFRSDMRYGSMGQKIQEADELMQMVMNVPFLQQVPGFMQKVIEKALDARGETELARMIREYQQPSAPPGLPPGMPGAPPGAVPPQGVPA